jgi:hypothetical protein
MEIILIEKFGVFVKMPNIKILKIPISAIIEQNLCFKA